MQKLKALFSQQMAQNVHVNLKNKIADIEEKYKEMKYIKKVFLLINHRLWKKLPR